MLRWQIAGMVFCAVVLLRSGRGARVRGDAALAMLQKMNKVLTEGGD